MAYLSADQILGAQDLRSEDVEVPEWGGTVRVQGMTGSARDKFEASLMNDGMDGVDKAKALDNYRARLSAACMVDGEGKRLFRSEAEVRRLGEKSADALSRVADVATRLSGLSAGDVEELTGN